MRIASVLITVRFSINCGACFRIVSGNASARTESISTAMTCETFGSKAKVNEPKPGPISTTASMELTFDWVTIRLTVFGSITKFCPNFFVGVMFKAFARARTSVAPR